MSSMEQRQPLMRKPLQDALDSRRDTPVPDGFEDAEEVLRTVFETAQGRANAYAAERIQELYEVAERAMALGGAFIPPAVRQEQSDDRFAWHRLPRLAGRYGGGLLLAAAAPLVADSSVLLAIACGIGALASFAVGVKSPSSSLYRAFQPRGADAKLIGVLSATDQALHAMTAPREKAALTAPVLPLQEDDVLSFLQDALMAKGEGADELVENASRLLDRAGYTPARNGGADLFEVMVDPAVDGDILLKPALIHKSDPAKNVFGLMVRGRS